MDALFLVDKLLFVIDKVLFEACDLGQGLSLSLFQVFGVNLGLGEREHGLLKLALLLRKGFGGRRQIGCFNLQRLDKRVVARF